ncbi:hypothetical protein M747DRAFT_155824 [Aspergillus niger ATCC 13496]|uniref:Uncharacterized protein n=1 Tax=Aspergillus niger ATCC 13496 TaxID=1353008 RepID=A0A370C7C1_ASPNG|nr:hypothetical protein M747DRAFT_155824 [Aspergillus niger ATCC 13496]
MSNSVPVAPRCAFSPVAPPPCFFVVTRNRAARWKVTCSRYICIASYRDNCVGLMGGHGGVRRVGYRHAEQLNVGRRVHAIRGGWHTEFIKSTWSRCPCLGCTLIYYVLEALSAASCGCVEVYSALMYLSPNMNMMYRPDYRVSPLSTTFPSDTVWV